MSDVNQFVRFDTTPPQKAPPPADAIDLTWDSETGSLQIVKPDGGTTPISGAEHTITVSGTISPNMNVTLYPVGEIDGKTAWASTGRPYSNFLDAVTGVFLYSEEGFYYVLAKINNSTAEGLWVSTNYPSRPDAITGWLPNDAETGTPVLTYQ